jgi:hypothetical protein
MDDDSQLLRSDLLILARQMLDKAVEEDDGKKLHIGEVLGVLAAAIEEDKIRSLAKTMTGWARETLGGTNVERPGSSVASDDVDF